jgi:hypothetical protein
LTVSEQQAEQTSGEPGSIGAGPAVPNSSEPRNQPVLAQEPLKAAIEVESPNLVPEQGEAQRVDAPKVEAPKAGSTEADAPRTPGKVMIMAGERAWDGGGRGPEAESGQNSAMFGKRRLAALAAVVALAAVTGALGGALATAGRGYFVGDDATTVANRDATIAAGRDATTAGIRALEASVARIDADILALRAGVEHTSKVGMTQFNKTSDRLDKIEKAQAEPAAKLARLSEAVDKLRAAPPVAPAAAGAPAPVAAKEVTGSVAVPPAAAAPATAPKAEAARLPTVDGWVLRDVANGGALIEGRRGIFEVYAGDPVPGLGRVDAIRRQDGHWVVVTSKGLIVAR